MLFNSHSVAVSCNRRSPSTATRSDASVRRHGALLQRFDTLFHDLLVTKIASHLGEYQGVRVTLGLSRTSADTEIVITTVERSKNPTTQVDWIVGTTTGSPKIVNLVTDGASLRLTQSSDFTAYLARHQYNRAHRGDAPTDCAKQIVLLIRGILSQMPCRAIPLC